MKISNNVSILQIKRGSVERFSSLNLHLDFVLFVHEPLPSDFFYILGISLYILESLIDN